MTPDPDIEFVKIEKQVLADLRIGDAFLGHEPSQEPHAKAEPLGGGFDSNPAC